LAAKSGKSTKPTVKRVRVQQTTKVEYSVAYRFDHEPTESDPTVIHETGITTFIAEKAELMDTYIDPNTKRREYISMNANGLRADRTTGQVNASHSVYLDDDKQTASSSYDVSSEDPIMSVYIPNLVGSATRELHLQFDAKNGRRIQGRFSI
jgi:hypothetical protein